jgi:hypothetical protein
MSAKVKAQGEFKVNMKLYGVGTSSKYEFKYHNTPTIDYNRKAIWVHQTNKRKKKLVKSLGEWAASDMSHRMAVLLYNVDTTLFDQEPSQQWDFWAWVDEPKELL